MTTPTQIRVLLVDDQELVRAGLRRILRRRDGFEIVGECGDGADVPAALAACDVDVVVMDLRMKRVDGIGATRRLRQAGDRPPVLALTTFDDDELLAGVLRAGAAGYILKDSAAEDLIRAVRAVAAGNAWLDAAVTARVLTAYRQAADDRPTSPPHGLLTPRELDVLRAVGRGLSNGEIAETLTISEATVKSHLGRLLSKLDLRDRAAAIVYAFDQGIVTPERDADPTLTTHPLPADAPPPRQPVVRQRRARTTAPPRQDQIRFSVLGPLHAWYGTQQLDLGPIRQQALLVALLLRPDVTVSRTELLHSVWGSEPPGTGERVLPVYIHRLRRCLRAADHKAPESMISRTRGGYRFVGNIWIDTVQLTALIAEANAAEGAGDQAGAVHHYTRALGLFRGEPLAGLPGPFAESERFRLTERRLALWQRKAQLQLDLGQYAEMTGELYVVLAANPWSEPLAALLMHALTAAGRRADALTVYRRTRDRLANDLGVEPGDRLRRAYQTILDQDRSPTATGPERHPPHRFDDTGAATDER